MATSAQAGRTDWKALYRRLDTALARIERMETPSDTLAAIVENLMSDFAVDLGFHGGRVYRREGEDYVLISAHGESRSAPLGLRVPRNYPPHVKTLSEGLVIVGPEDEGFDSEVERTLGVTSTFAAIAVGPHNGHVIAFSVKGELQEERILYSLSAVRHVIHLKLEQQRMSGMLDEARVIQESLLPARAPQFPGFEFAGCSRPTEVVGGDLYDFVPLSDGLLGIAIADASGHGLPAALLARDVVTGLRMAIDEDWKVARIVERLNRVIHRAALSSKFISLFFCELHEGGSLVYCNAGHHPPLHERAGVFHRLSRGGLVLGPNPAARYESGHIRMRAGDRLVLYTDGLVERPDPSGRPFGTRRLRKVLKGIPSAGAETTVRAVFAASDAWASGAPAPDDVTAVVIRRV